MHNQKSTLQSYQCRIQIGRRDILDELLALPDGLRTETILDELREQAG